MLVAVSGYPTYCLDVPKNCSLAYRVDLKRMTSRLAATTGLAAQPAQQITGADTKRWILKRLHHKTVLEKLDECGIGNDINSRLLCDKHYSNKKYNFFLNFLSNRCCFLFEGKA
jgi:hypothetical protein